MASSTSTAFCGVPFVAYRQTQTQSLSQSLSQSSFRPSFTQTASSRRVLAKSNFRQVSEATAVASPPVKEVVEASTNFEVATRNDVVTVAFCAHVDHVRL